MGNTPSQQPFEGSSSDAEESTAGGSLTGSVRRAVRSVATTCRATLAKLWPSTRTADGTDADADGDDERADESESTTTTDDPTPARTDRLPARTTPFTHPSRDRDDANRPDLRATEDDGTLSIYYPDHDDATITSDTWEQVER